MHTLDDWIKILHNLTKEYPSYQAGFNGDGKGVAVTFRNKKTPQLITVYPHKAR